jgi:hypothetical protein
MWNINLSNDVGMMMVFEVNPLCKKQQSNTKTRESFVQGWQFPNNMQDERGR